MTKAREWFQKAADQGNVDAQTLLGMLYHYGKGVDLKMMFKQENGFKSR